jgi:hypothetical protein
MYDTTKAKSIMHRFWECETSQWVWLVSFFLLQTLTSCDEASLRDIHWRHALLGEPLDAAPPIVQRFWLLIRGATM